MLRSMYSAVSGLRNHQTKMDVIGNNISNVNTYGFKAGRVVFKDVFSQTLKSASGGNANIGGTNPMQVGLGVSTASVDTLFDTSAPARTDRTLDLAISGDGLFIVKVSSGAAFTRAGNFYIEAPQLDDTGVPISPSRLVNVDGLPVLGIQRHDGTAPDTTIDLPTLMDPANPYALTDASGTLQLQEIYIPNGFTYAGINDKGEVLALDQSNKEVTVAVIPMATFANYGGLTKAGSNLYTQSQNSGIAAVAIVGNPAAGEILAGMLEMSNVDLSREFTEMIVTQRGFQANSRVITVSDTLLEELVNLKR